MKKLCHYISEYMGCCSGGTASNVITYLAANIFIVNIVFPLTPLQ